MGAADRQITAFPNEVVTSPPSIKDVAWPGLVHVLEVLQKVCLAVQEAVPPQAIKDRFVRLHTPRTIRVRLHSYVLSTEDRDRCAYVVFLMDNLLARFRLEQALQLAAFRCRSVRALVLILLAVCRRYGRRAEPDDHALLKRRPPTFRGVACTAS